MSPAPLTRDLGVPRGGPDPRLRLLIQDFGGAHPETSDVHERLRGQMLVTLGVEPVIQIFGVHMPASASCGASLTGKLRGIELNANQARGKKGLV